MAKRKRKWWKGLYDLAGRIRGRGRKQLQRIQEELGPLYPVLEANLRRKLGKLLETSDRTFGRIKDLYEAIDTAGGVKRRGNRAYKEAVARNASDDEDLITISVGEWREIREVFDRGTALKKK